MRFLLADLKRGLTEKNFLGAVILASIVLLVSFLITWHNGQVVGVDGLFMGAQSLILPFIAPLLVAMPYANMNMLEKDSGFKRLMQLKGGMKHYDLRRWLVVGVVSGVTLLLPTALLALICMMGGAYSNPNLIIQVIALAFGFGFAYGSLAYSLTFYNEKRYIPTITPQVVYLLLIYAFPYLGLEAYYPPLAISPWLLGGEVTIGGSVEQLLFISGIAVIGILLARLLKVLAGLSQKGVGV